MSGLSIVEVHASLVALGVNGIKRLIGLVVGFDVFPKNLVLFEALKEKARVNLYIAFCNVKFPLIDC